MKNHKGKIFVGLLFIFICWKCNQFVTGMTAAGSYPFVEYWELNSSETELLEIIKSVKANNTELQLPNEKELTSGRNSYWYYINFYYEDSNEIVHTWVRERNDSITTFAFVGISEFENNEKYRRINRDYNYFSNKIELKKFKRIILSKILEKTNRVEKH